MLAVFHPLKPLPASGRRLAGVDIPSIPRPWSEARTRADTAADMSAEESLRRTARRLRSDDEDTIAAGRCRQASVRSEAVAGLPVLCVETGQRSTDEGGAAGRTERSPTRIPPTVKPAVYIKDRLRHAERSDNEAQHV